MDGFVLDQTHVEAQSLGDILGERAGAPQATGAAVAVDFLKWLDPAGRHNLVALDPSGCAPPEGKTFEPDQRAEMLEWIGRRNNRLNLYYSVNEPAPGAPDKKLADRDIAAIRAVVADLDPRQGEPLDAERARLKTLATGQGGKPAVIDSGGGCQLLWRLEEKLDPATHSAAVRAQCRGVAKALGGDAVIDTARILRLPGTVNLPDAKKLARGRAPALSSVISIGGSTSLPTLAALFPPAAVAEQADNDDETAKVQAALDMPTIRGTNGIDELDEPLRARLQFMLANDKQFARLWDGDPDVLPGEDKSGSAFRAKLAWCMGREGGFTAQHYGEVLYAWPHAVLAGQDIEERVTVRTIARDWVRCAVPVSPEKHFGPIADTAATSAPPLPSKSVPTWSLISVQDAARNALKRSGTPLIKGLLDEATLSVLYGESNVGKTFVALDLALHVSIGMPWAGMRTARRAVMYVAAEGGPGIGKRCLAAALKFGAAFESALFSLRVESADLLNPTADLEPLIAAALASVDPIGFIVIDTLSRALAGGDENSSVDMGALVKNVDAIRRRTGAHVMLVHHSGKDTARGARGHSLLRAATDTEIEIAEGQLTVRKQRDLDKSFQTSFSLETLIIGKDDDGDSISSCVFRIASQADVPRGEPTAAEANIIEAIEEILNGQNVRQSGVSAKSLADFLSEEGRVVTDGNVRMQLKRLREKNLVKKIGRLWTLADACCALIEPNSDKNRGELSAQQLDRWRNKTFLGEINMLGRSATSATKCNSQPAKPRRKAQQRNNTLRVLRCCARNARLAEIPHKFISDFQL